MRKRLAISFIQCLALSIAILLSGCATVFSESQHPVFIDSQQSGQSVTVSTLQGEIIASGETPLTLILPAYGSGFSPAHYLVQLDSPEGTVKKSLSGSIQPITYLNVLGSTAGLLGVLIDAYTGTIYKLPNSVFIDTQPEHQNVLEDESILE